MSTPVTIISMNRNHVVFRIESGDAEQKLPLQQFMNEVEINTYRISSPDMHELRVRLQIKRLVSSHPPENQARYATSPLHSGFIFDPPWDE